MSDGHPWALAPDEHTSDFEVIRWVVGSLLPALRAECGAATVGELAAAAKTARINELAARRLKPSLLFRAVAGVDLKKGVITFDDIRVMNVIAGIVADGGTFRYPKGRIGPLAKGDIFIARAA